MNEDQKNKLPPNIRTAFVIAGLLSALYVYNEDKIIGYLTGGTGHGQVQAPAPQPK